MGKVIIDKRENCILLFLMDESGHPQLIQSATLPEKEDILGNIYVGRVAEVIPGIRAAFVSISSTLKVFLPLSECTEPMLINREFDGNLKQGDELIVQIIAPALKTKQPGATTKLSLTGRYCVCQREGHGISCSSKLDKEAAARLKEAVQEASAQKLIPEDRKQYHFILRTNAGTLKDLTPLFDEIRQFIAFFRELETVYDHRKLYSCLYYSEPEIIRLLKDIPTTAYEEIVTDEPGIYEILTNSFGNERVRFYQDHMLPLSKLYSIDTHLQEALGKKVWLKCGGYLVIEPTEAMVVIDVNSGKAESKGKKSRDYYLKVNLEAAGEVARQLRIRNYSGMIMVDFINMESEEDKNKLLSFLDECLKEDRVRTRLVDMTALGIVEITRKKTSKPLSEWITNLNSW